MNLGMTSGVLLTMKLNALTPPFVRDVMSAPCSKNKKRNGQLVETASVYPSSKLAVLIEPKTPSRPYK